MSFLEAPDGADESCNLRLAVVTFALEHLESMPIEFG
jgi:hypothetical protein